MEMKAFNVIENDIRVEEIWTLAQACGFADMKLSFAMPRQELVTLDDFNRILERRSAPDEIVFSPTNAAIHQNRRVFFLYKSSSIEMDSRAAEGLQYTMQLVELSPHGKTARLVLELKNTGKAIWRPSGGEPGSVNIGAHLRTLDGQLVNNDFTRLAISDGRILPGQELRLTADLPLPDIASFELELDLVAEDVAWFELLGSKTLRLPFHGGQYTATR